jgi:hypothetical protein
LEGRCLGLIEVTSQQLTGGNEETHENPPILGVPVETRIGHLTNAGLGCYHYADLVALLHGTVVSYNFLAPGYRDGIRPIVAITIISLLITDTPRLTEFQTYTIF